MKSYRKISVILLVLGTVLSTCVFAENSEDNGDTSERKGETAQHHPVGKDYKRLQPDSAAFSKMDQDKNGFLSNEEFKKFDPKHSFVKVDENKDSKISQDEFSKVLGVEPQI